VDLTGTPYAYTSGDPVNAIDPSGDLLCQAGGTCGTSQYFESRPATNCRAPGSSSGWNLNPGEAILGLGTAGATSQSISGYFNSRGETAGHLDEGGYLWNAERSINFSNAARGLAVVGAAATVYNDVSSGKSAGYTVGDVAGSAAGGAVGGTVGAAICLGPEDGIAVVCGIIGGAIGGKIGGYIGSTVGSAIESGFKDVVSFF
jgi:hypothetical protein